MVTDQMYPPTVLYVRLTKTRTGAIRIEHGYARGAEVDEWRPWCQVPQGERRIRRVWNELRVCVAVWLERDRLDRREASEDSAETMRVDQ